jgi:hypothetical protein
MSNLPALSKSVLLLISLIAVMSSCAQRQTNVTIEAGDPLRFAVSGKGIVEYFSVSGVNSPNALHMYWQIAPIKDTDLTSLERIGPIVYGKVPSGFRQVVPEHGEPQPIRQDEQGGLYWLSLEIRNGPGAGKKFAFRDGKILVEGQGAWR